MTRIVSLKKKWIRGFSNYELRDLGEYFDPSAFVLINGSDGRLSQRIERATGVPVLSTGIPDDVEVQDLTLASVTSLDDLETVVQRKKDKHVCFVTDLVRRRRSGLEPQWVNRDEYLEIMQEHDGRSHHLLTDLSGDERPEHNGYVFHGIDSVQGDTFQFPVVDIGEDVRSDCFPTNKFGLQAVNELGDEMKERLERRGVTTRHELMRVPPEELLKVKGIGPHRACNFTVGAGAIEKGEIYWYADDPLEGKDRIYLDIETDGKNPGIIWLIGAYVEEQNAYEFFIENEDPHRTGRIITDFMEWLEEYPEAVLVSWYGNQFDYVHLERFIRKHCSRRQIELWEQMEKEDLLRMARSRFALPCRHYGLDSVADRLNIDLGLTDSSGKDAARAYINWKHSGKEPDWEKWVNYCVGDAWAVGAIYQRTKSAEQVFEKHEVERKYQEVMR